MLPMLNEKLSYSPLDITFLVDENLNNYKEIHDWLLGLGFLKTIHNFKTYKQTDKIDFNTTRSTNKCWQTI